MPIRDLTSVLFLTALIGGCAERLEPEGAPLEELPSDPSGPEAGSFPSRSGKFAHVVGSDGVITTVVDASDDSSWQILDLDSGHAGDEGWDLGFSRFRVKSNGGVSGGGGVQVAPLDGVEFASVDEPPASGWLFDREAEASDDAPAFVSALRNAFHREDAEWYEYDGATHMLTPKDITFVVASSAGRFYELRFDSYYDDAGSPAVVKFRWAELDGDEPELPPIDVEPAPVTPEEAREPDDLADAGPGRTSL